MAELGALSLKIEAIGDKQVLAALNAIETKARTVDKTTTDAVAALKSLGIAAKTVGGQVAVASGEMEKAATILKAMGNTARLVSAENVQAAKVEANANRVRARGFQDYLTLLTTGARIESSRADSLRQLAALEAALQKQLQATNLTFEQRVRIGETLGRVQVAMAGGIQATTVATEQASTRISAFGKSGLNAFNAVSFGISQMAATGTTSFRSLATATASVLSFFGPQGAITAAVVSTGLVLLDFWRRQKKEVAEFQTLVKDLVDESKKTNREKDPFTFATEELDQVNTKLAEAEARRARIETQAEAFRKREGFFSRDSLDQLTAVNAEIAQLQQSQFQAERRVSDAIQKMTKGLPAKKVEGKSNEQLTRESQQAIAAEIDALSSLAKTRGLTSVETVRMAALEGKLTAELKASQPTKEREAEIWEQIAKARQSATVRTVGPAQVRDLVSGTPDAKKTITTPPSVAAFLDPTRIAADTQNADREIARQAAALKFQQTSDALSLSLANAIVSGIASGFAVGLGQGGIGQGFKQMAAQLATGLGSVAIDYGLKAEAIAKFMAGISKFLIANPVLAIGLGIGLVALGRAMGGSTGGASSGGGGGFGGGSIGSSFGGTSSIERLIIDPNAGVRQRMAARASGSAQVSAPVFQVIEAISPTSSRGQEIIGTAYDRYAAKRA